MEPASAKAVDELARVSVDAVEAVDSVDDAVLKEFGGLVNVEPGLSHDDDQLVPGGLLLQKVEKSAGAFSCCLGAVLRWYCRTSATGGPAGLIPTTGGGSSTDVPLSLGNCFK